MISSLPLHRYKMIVKTTECLAPDGVQLMLVNHDTSRTRRELCTQMRLRDDRKKLCKLTSDQDTRAHIYIVRVTILLVR